MSTNRGYIRRFRESRTSRGIVAFLILNLLFETIQPTVSLALTEGPSQPEVQSFEPIGTTDMVDLFTGDFNYNIPLFNLPGPNGGYPVNLAYHAGSTVDDESSWVGLGWNINAGGLVRNMRGLPDEFLSKTDASGNVTGGDFLNVKSDMKQNMTVGLSGKLEGEVFGGELPASASLSVYYNNYRGLGASLDATIHTTGTYAAGAGISLDSENGMGVTAELSYRHYGQDAENRHKLSFTFDGDLSIGYSLKKTTLEEIKRKDGSVGIGSENYGSAYTFARSSFSPSLAYRMTNWNASVSFFAGPSVLAAYAGVGGSLFYRTEDYDGLEKDGRKHPVVGYDKAGTEGGNYDYYTRDFSRERDGRVTSGTIFLPQSNYTYDVYNSSGQGLSGYFRPKRNDIGRSQDPSIQNQIFGGSLTIEITAAPGGGYHAALDEAGLNYGYMSQGAWQDNTDMNYDFKEPKPKSTGSTAKENLHYIAHGEPVIIEPEDIQYMKSLDLPFLKLTPKGSNAGGYAYGGKRHLEASFNPGYSAEKADTQRNKRNTTIHNLTNAEVTNLGEFSIRYYNWTSNLNYATAATAALDRTLRQGTEINNHYAGFKVLNEEGAYYVYNLPAYNNKDVSNLFSVDKNTPQGSRDVNIDIKDNEVDYKKYDKGHQFINKTEKSPYAHSYLLTSVQGADYVDLTNDGPTEDDLGYWVKFSYVKKASNFKWRSPYDHARALFSPNARYTDEDDKASYQYGEKELWYMGKMETKTHVAIFKMSERQDMVEAAGEKSHTTATDLDTRNVPLKLDQIVIYDKKSFADAGESARPIQKVHFEYSYRLCPGTPSSRSTGQKKMTLEKVYFTSNGSNRGELNKYQFYYGDYQIGEDELEPNFENPSYRDGAYDSWGIYKPVVNDEFAANFPYVNQFNQDWNPNLAWEPADYGSDKADNLSRYWTKYRQAGLAAAWSLRRITLPSGGYINISYESDDYGYVQHKTANQMFKIASVGRAEDGLPADQLYKDEDAEFVSFPERRRIYFKLEVPIPVSTPYNDVATKIYKEYVEPIHAENGVRNLYFKSKMKLTPEVEDYVSGYLPLEKDLKQSDGSIYFFGAAQNNNEINNLPAVASIDGQNCYTHGFVTLKATPKIRKPSEEYNYHPMSLAAWTYMQTDAQELLMNNNSFSDDVNDSNIWGKIGDFFNVIPMVAESYGRIRHYCARKNLARFINLDMSCIRLASPDKIKFGGGHRVKSISITDEWGASTANTSPSRTYGQTYDYTMVENGKVISSGVAAYEPQAGGDENALKYPYYYQEKQTYFTSNNLFAEAPVNESLFPGASVGYRKVTVRSLHTDASIVSGADGRTSGVTEHEFYTAKDFPTMVEFSPLKEENSTLDVYNLGIPIPLIGSLKYNYYHGTQAYKIELNDMHGKPKSTRTYEVINHVVNPSPITEMVNEYQCDPVSYMGEKVWKLNNEVSIINNDDTHVISGVKKLMGVEVDLFTDQRESKTFNMNAGIDFNVDVLPFPIPAITFWPSYSNTKQLFRTYVTNKVIHRKGILKKTVTRDVQAKNSSEIIAFDEKSGNPILTKMTNEFGDDFYNYNIPAYYKYDGMGHAYRNIDYTFDADMTPGENCYYTIPSAGRTEHLVRGDEVLVEVGDVYKKAYFLGWIYDNSTNNIVKGMLHFPYGNFGSGVTAATFRVIRSGRRNHYATMAANYVSKGMFSPVNSTLTISKADGTSYTAKKFAANSVLSATASLFRDDWTDGRQGTYRSQPYTYTPPDRPERTDLLEIFENDDVSNPFITGGSGIWRSHKTYTYVGERKATRALDNGPTNPDLKNDGLFIDAVPVFDWSLGVIEEYSHNNANPFSKWEWMKEVTRYSTEAYELENVDRQGIFSAALYGYNNSLSIGVSGNASQNEIGTMDFETVSNTTKFGETIFQTNINMYKSTTDRPQKMLVSEHRNFSKAVVNADKIDIYMKFKDQAERDAFTANFNNLNYVNTSTPPPPANYQNGGELENTFGISLVSKATSGQKGNESTFLNGKFVGDPYMVSTTEARYTFKVYICTPGDVPRYLKNATQHYGRLTMLFKKKVSDLVPVQNFSFVKNGVEPVVAHSGKACMKVTANSEFDQPKLKVIAGKPYVFSCWVSRADQDVKSYQQNILLQVCAMDVFDGTNTQAYLEIPNVKYRYGKVIEGWQKIDAEFTIVPGSYYANKVFLFKFNPGTRPLFVDDIRFSPRTGGMKTFVYDPVNYRLSASLNVDNYATFFHYNEEGTLSMTKQETEEGIVTISQNRGRLKK